MTWLPNIVACMQRWSGDYHDASVALQGREEAVAAQAELLEGGLSLIGATAVEDRLQEGVPQAISTLSAAGIKVAFFCSCRNCLFNRYVTIPSIMVLLPASRSPSSASAAIAS